jgi:hypothetical protein
MNVALRPLFYPSEVSLDAENERSQKMRAGTGIAILVDGEWKDFSIG